MNRGEQITRERHCGDVERAPISPCAPGRSTASGESAVLRRRDEVLGHRARVIGLGISAYDSGLSLGALLGAWSWRADHGSALR